MSSSNTPALRGWRHLFSGKEREIYYPAGQSTYDSETVLIVATDRFSAYGQVFPTEIPGKGLALTQLTTWWLEQLGDCIPNHFLSTSSVPEMVAGRAMICRHLDMYPLECHVSGYLVGQAWREYQEKGTIAGVRMPEGLQRDQKLDKPVFNPVAKTQMGRHDNNVSWEALQSLVGSGRLDKIIEYSLDLYERSAKIAWERGVILGSTKFEFGSALPYGGEAVVLGDEVLTPDSSRFWNADSYQVGKPNPQLDSQMLRDWVDSEECHWQPYKLQTPPEIPESVVQQTANRYQEIYETLTGRTLNE